MKDKFTYRLLTMEYMRNLIEEIHTPETYFKKLVIDGKENTNLRLWVLRCMLELKEKEMAEKLKIPFEEYKKYEKSGEKVPEKVLKKISRKFGVSWKWLKCKLPQWFPEIKGLK